MPKKSSGKKLAANVRASVKGAKKAFQNIKQSVKAASKQAKQFKQSADPAPKKRTQDVYSLRNAPFSKGGTFAEKIQSLEANAERFDALKADDEYWAFSYFGNRSLVVYEDIKLALRKLAEYKASKEHGEDEGEEGQDLIDGVKLFKFKSSAKQYKVERNEIKVARDTEKKGIIDTVTKMFGSKIEGSRRKKTTVDLLKDLLSERETMLKRLEALETRNAKPAKVVRKVVVKKSAKVKASAKALKAAKAAATKRSEAAKRAAVTRKANRERAAREAAAKFAKRSKAAKKAAKTRKTNKRKAGK